MRPLKLNMTAFGAYADTVALDFESGLNGNNFFLIHGTTGSGKTTILDAICYALYGKSSGDERRGKMLRSDQAGLSRNTEVEFTFSLNDKIYRVFRNLNFGNEDSTAELYINDTLTTRGLRNVNEYIKSQIGFSDEQFRQVVILPQGNFKKFLSANSRAKAELLESIFDADIYKLVEETLKNKAKTAKTAFVELNTKRDFILNEAAKFGDVKNIPALIETVNDNLIKASKLNDELEIKLRDAQSHLTAGEILIKDFANLDIAAKNLQTAKDSLVKISKDLTAAQIEFDKRKGEEPQRREVDNKINKLNEINAAIVEYNKQQDALTKAAAVEKIAKETLTQLEVTQKKYDNRMNVLKKQEQSLQNADAELVKAQKILVDAKERDACVKKIAQLQKDFAAANKNLADADKKYNDANVNLERLRTLQKNGAVANLASTLKDGEPCPVCGATIHPQPATCKGVIPTDDEIAAAEKILKKLQANRDNLTKAVASIGGELKTQQDALKKFADVLEISAAQKLCDNAKKSVNELKICRQNISKGEVCIKDNQTKLEAARRDFETKSKAAANLRGIVDEKQKQIPQEYSTAPNKLVQDLSALQKSKRELESAWKSAEEIFHRLNNQKSAQEGKLQAAEKSVSDATAKVAGKVKPNIADLKTKFDNARKAKDAAVANVTTLKNNLSRLKQIADDLKKLDIEMKTAEDTQRIFEKLSNVANGKISFSRYYLDSMFQGVIVEANMRLDKMSGGRFQFRGNKNELSKNRLEGLDLEILDAYTGKARPVETLSGGESFLASLSLALGLAAVVQNNAGGMKLDTIFIDEGFGSLDSETLDNAINTLSELQTGGRLVGIISHVDELKNRIPVRLEVTKGKFGSSAKFVS